MKRRQGNADTATREMPRMRTKTMTMMTMKEQQQRGEGQHDQNKNGSGDESRTTTADEEGVKDRPSTIRRGRQAQGGHCAFFFFSRYCLFKSHSSSL
jgi:hypothetical protein